VNADREGRCDARATFGKEKGRKGCLKSEDSCLGNSGLGDKKALGKWGPTLREGFPDSISFSFKRKKMEKELWEKPACRKGFFSIEGTKMSAREKT